MRRLVLALGLLAAPSLAQAATILDTVALKDCDPSGQLANEKLRDKILAANKVPLSSEILRLYASGQFGAEAARRAANCDPTNGCTGEKTILPRTFEAVAPLSTPQPETRPGFTVVVDPATAPAPAQRPIAFLDGNWVWLKITCEAVPAAAKKDEPKPADRFFTPPSLVIAKSEDDAGKSFDKRGFATIGYSNDKVKGESTFDLDLFLGFSDPFRRRDTSVSMQPFVAYQRHSKKQVDDLSAGASWIGYPAVGGQLRFKPAWETDHEFKSSAFRADLTWSTPLLDFCEARTVPEVSYLSCELSAVADYADIADAGDKKSLADLSSFARIGGDLLLEYGHWVAGQGFMTLSGKYQARHDLSDHEADAEFATVSLGFSPGKTSPYKVSIDYTNGRDLSSFGKVESVVLPFGFRR